MLSSNNISTFPSRRGTIGRALKNAFAAPAEEPAHELIDYALGLYSVTLSDSITSLDNLSPGLYSWLNHGEFAAKQRLRLFSASGELISDPIPKHLTAPYTPPLPPTDRRLAEEQQMFSVAPLNAVAKESMRKQARFARVINLF